MVVFVFDWTIEVVNIMVAVSIGIIAKIIATYFSDRIRELREEVEEVNRNLWNINYRLTMGHPTPSSEP